MPTIRIDDEVYAWLQAQAKPFEDTPNTVLRRIAALERESKGSKEETPARRRSSSHPPGDKTPQREFRPLILKCLRKLGGGGERQRVLQQLERIMAGRLSEHDLSDINSGGPRWQKSAEWEVRTMREEGLLKPVSDTPRGVWALTIAGEDEASKT